MSQFDIFSVLGVPNDFLLNPGYFGYYVMSLWVLFKPFVLADFTDSALSGTVGGGTNPSSLVTSLDAGVGGLLLPRDGSSPL